VIVGLLPFALLLLLEGLLRVVGYGQDYALFVDAPDHPGYRMMSPNVSEKYFATPENATLGNQELFLADKDSSTFRIFVLGASTGLGYPYLHNGSFHRWLHYRLMHAVPEVNFEIINLSLTAVTTYTLLDFGQQLVDYEPDAVLVYAGHNEYYGTLGVGSTSRLGNNPTLVRAMIGLRDFRLVQLIGNAVNGLRRSLAGAPDLRTNLMQRLAAEQAIPLGSDLYERGVTQYEINLNDLLEVLDRRQVPVLLSNLVSNEKDLPPFVSDRTAGEASAAAQFEQGQRAYAQKKFAEAKTHFVQAKERDQLRFRAPEAMNAVVQRLADRYANVTLVDAQEVFAAHSPHGIFGQETLLEHVHPNLYGYALLSEAFYQALRRTGLVEVPEQSALSLEALQRQMPITAVDSLRGAYETMILKEGWPFNEPMPPIEEGEKTVEEALAGRLVVQQITWDEAMQQLLRHYVQTEQRTEAMRVAEALVLEHSQDARVYQQAGTLAQQAQAEGKGLLYLKRAFALSPTLEVAQTLFVALLKRDQPEAALPYLDYAVQTHGKFAELRSFAQNIVRLKQIYAQDTNQHELALRVAAAYLRFANATAARPYVNQALAADPTNPTARELRAKIDQLATQE
jgi:lysophospholipase L1-like esterase